MSWKSRRLNLLEPSGPHQACYGTPFTLLKGEKYLASRSSCLFFPSKESLTPLEYQDAWVLYLVWTLERKMYPSYWESHPSLPSLSPLTVAYRTVAGSARARSNSSKVKLHNRKATVSPQRFRKRLQIITVLNMKTAISGVGDRFTTSIFIERGLG